MLQHARDELSTGIRTRCLRNCPGSSAVLLPARLLSLQLWFDSQGGSVLAAAPMGASAPSPPTQLRPNPTSALLSLLLAQQHHRSPRRSPPPWGAPGGWEPGGALPLHPTGLTPLWGRGPPHLPALLPCSSPGAGAGLPLGCRLQGDCLQNYSANGLVFFFPQGFLSPGAFYNVCQEKKKQPTQPHTRKCLCPRRL